MQLNRLILEELEQEALSTRKLLACVPDEHLAWQPHEKSMTLGRLATHVAELPIWINRALEADEFDFAAAPYQPRTLNSKEEIISFFEECLTAAKALLENASNESLSEQWTFRRGDFVISSCDRYRAVRGWMMNHQVHHRGQLSVYLRLLDIPIPGLYGPSADDIIARQKAVQQ